MRRVLLLVTMAACGDDAVHHLADAPPGTGDEAGVNHNSTILLAQSPGGPGNGDPATWGGVLQFQVTGDGAALVAGLGLAKAQLHDPVALVYQPTLHELFVGERHGNNAADGVAGSIARFRYDQTSHALTANGAITGNGLAGVHQVAFSPTTGELFAANVNGPISRFTIDAAGTATPHGTLALPAVRGVWVSPDGGRLYATSFDSQLHQFDLATGAELAAVTVAGSGTQLHFFAQRGTELYVAGLSDNAIHRFEMASDGTLTFVADIAADSPVGVAFSADGLEMFATGHRDSDLLDRYRYDAATDSWTKTDAIDEGSSLGGIAVLPG